MFTILPYEINNHILSFLLSSVKIKKFIKENNKITYTYLLVSHDLYLKSELIKYKNIIYYLNKYKTYQREYDYSYVHGFNKDIIYTNPILCDILYTELNIPFSRSTYNIIRPELLTDLENIIKLMPETINSEWCHLRCRTNITPLYIACINRAIPLDVVKLLIKYGGNCNHKIKINGRKCSILKDMTCKLYLRNEINDGVITVERYNALAKILG